MKILLKETIRKLGLKGGIVEVKNGYARNFLLPKKLALPITKKTEKVIERQKIVLQKKLEEEFITRQGVADRIKNTTLKISMKSSAENKIFGSVTLKMVLQLLEEEHISIEKDAVNFDFPIKQLGSYEIPINLGHEVRCALNIDVVSDKEEEDEEENNEKES